MQHRHRQQVNPVNRHTTLTTKLPRLISFDAADVSLDPTEAWMERQLQLERMSQEQLSETSGNAPLRSNWPLLEEAMYLFCTSSVRPVDPYGRHGSLDVRYFNTVHGSSELPYWDS